MGLRDEIDRLIAEKRASLQQRDEAHSEHHQRQQERFSPLAALLREFVGSIDSRFVNATILDDRATIEIGEHDGDRFKCSTRFKVEPNSEVDWGTKLSEALFKEAPGFRLSETHYYDIPGEYDVSEREQVLESESEVAQRLIEAAADTIAHHQHIESLRAKRTK